MAQLRQDTGLPMTGLFLQRAADYSFAEQYDTEYEPFHSLYPTHLTHFCGFAELTQQSLADMHFKLAAGKLPDGNKNEIAISTAVCDTFIQAGYRAPVDRGETPLPQLQKINSPVSMVGKVIRLMGVDYTVSGVVDTGFDMSRFDRLKDAAESDTTADNIVNYMLYHEFQLGANYSLTGAAMVGAGKVEALAKDEAKIFDAHIRGHISMMLESDKMFGHSYAHYITTADLIPPEEVVWLDGAKTELKENEIVISLNNLHFENNSSSNGKEPETLEGLHVGEIGLTAESLKAMLNEAEGSWIMRVGYDDDVSGDYVSEEVSDLKIVGCVKPDGKYADAMVIAKKYADYLIDDIDGVYDSAVGPMPERKAGIEQFVRFCYPEQKDAEVRYEINHPVTYELDAVNEILQKVAKVFFWIGLFFAVFAALLMANFISTSIHYKRQEIGILRAIGSRSADVFRIFFSESLLIAMINFAFSSLFCAAAVFVINFLLRKRAGILITLLHFGIRQIVLLALISAATAAAASFIPVWRVASKRPIDAIRDK
jgi:hypothetical protein